MIYLSQAYFIHLFVIFQYIPNLFCTSDMIRKEVAYHYNDVQSIHIFLKGNGLL